MYQNPYRKIKPDSRKPYTEIYLIRHCNPDYSLEQERGEKNMPLSVLGKKQRRRLTKYLLTLNINSVYTSEIVRAQQTASIFLEKTRIINKVNKNINEIDWMYWQKIQYFHMTEKEREKKLKKYKELDAILDEMQAKARKALAKIYEKNKGKRVAVFSHGNFIKSLLTSILNADVIGFLSLEVFQGSVSKVIIDKDGYVKIAWINNISHLYNPPFQDPYITLIDEND